MHPNAPPSPSRYGWTVAGDRCYPTRYTKPALPNSFKEMVLQEEPTSGLEISDSDIETNIESDSDINS